MGNSEAIDMLRNTGPTVSLVVARVVDSNQSMRRQKGLSQEDLLQAVRNDELYGKSIWTVKYDVFIGLLRSIWNFEEGLNML